MFTLLTFAFIASTISFLQSLEIKFKDTSKNYSLNLSANSFVVSGIQLGYNVSKTENFTVTAIKIPEKAKVYTENLLCKALALELAPENERNQSQFSMFYHFGSEVCAAEGDLGVFVEFLPEKIDQYSWKLYLNFRKQNTTAQKAEGFRLYSYALKARVWNSTLIKDKNITQVYVEVPEVQDKPQLQWYANNAFASNYLCSNSTLNLIDGVQVMFDNLRVAASFDQDEKNTVYAVCHQDCAEDDGLCLRKGDGCATTSGECPAYTLPVQSSATSTYNYFVLYLLPLFLFLLAM